MDRRIIAFVVFIILVMVGVQLVVGLLRGEREELRGAPVQHFEFGEGRELHITGALVYPVRRPRLGLYYWTRAGEPTHNAAANERPDADADAEEARPPESFFATLPPERMPPEFVAHVSADGRVVGIAAASDPNALLILHDFARDESWPRRTEIETLEDMEPRAARLLSRLRRGLADADEAAAEDLRLVPAEDVRPLEMLIELPAEADGARE